MPRFRNEEVERQYKDGDIVWVKIHNSEIWWPGEVTSSQDFRFVNSTRRPYAVVEFFNERTFEQVNTSKLIYPFQCEHKKDFIKLGTRKSVTADMREKFNEDVRHAESRLAAERSSESAEPAVSRESLIKALLSSTVTTATVGTNTTVSIGAGAGTSNNNNNNNIHAHNNNNNNNIMDNSYNIYGNFNDHDSSIRIMDIGAPASAYARPEGRNDQRYECNLCDFHTSSMNVLLIHRRTHVEPSRSSTGNNQRPLLPGKPGGGGGGVAGGGCGGNCMANKSRASRRANTSISRDLASYSSLWRCQSRHVSIVVDAPLNDEEQRQVANIAQLTLASIERVVKSPIPCESSSNERPLAAVRRNTQVSSRDPRRKRCHQLRATMPAPPPLALPSPATPAKQRRLTRSCTRQQETRDSASAERERARIERAERLGRRRGLSAARATYDGDNADEGDANRGRGRARTVLAKTPTSQRSASSSVTFALPRQRPQQSNERSCTITSAAMMSTSTSPTPSPFSLALPSRATQTVNPSAATVHTSGTPAVSKEEQQQRQRSNSPNQIVNDSRELHLRLLAEWGDYEQEEPELEQEQRIEQAQQQQLPQGSQQQQQQQQPDDEADADAVADVVVDADADAEASPATNDALCNDVSMNAVASCSSSSSSSKRIRNIPKKDRRDVVLQEFDSSAESNCVQDEPILIHDSDASSNESVVFIDAAEPQRSMRASVLNPNPYPSAVSCFDFDEEDEHLEPAAMQPNAPIAERNGNGLSYRRRTKPSAPAPAQTATAAATAPSLSNGGEEPRSRKQSLAKSHEDVFKAFNEHQSQQQELEHEQDLETGAGSVDAEAEQSNLPIKERQKRIFKSRNKQREEQEQQKKQQQEQEQEREEDEDDAGQQEVALSLEHDEEDEEQQVVTSPLPTLSNGSSSDLKTDKRRQSNPSQCAAKAKSPSPIMSSYSLAQTPPTPTPTAEELSNSSPVQAQETQLQFQPQLPFASQMQFPIQTQFSGLASPALSHIHLHMNSNSNSSSHLTSNSNSNSNSSSILSNMAVISAEEARELQRSAPALAEESTTATESSGVLILEDILLPNLYEIRPNSQNSNMSCARVRSLASRASRASKASKISKSKRGSHGSSSSSSGSGNGSGTSSSKQHHGKQKPQKVEQQPPAKHSKDKTSAKQAKKAKHSKKEEKKHTQQQPLPSTSAAAQRANATRAESPTSPNRWSPTPPPVGRRFEVQLKEREREMLLKYEADITSGRRAEINRIARERWARARCQHRPDAEEKLLLMRLKEQRNFRLNRRAASEHPMAMRRENLSRPRKSPSCQVLSTLTEQDLQLARRQLLRLRDAQARRKRRGSGSQAAVEARKRKQELEAEKEKEKEEKEKAKEKRNEEQDQLELDLELELELDPVSDEAQEEQEEETVAEQQLEEQLHGQEQLHLEEEHEQLHLEEEQEQLHLEEEQEQLHLEEEQEQLHLEEEQEQLHPEEQEQLLLGQQPQAQQRQQSQRIDDPLDDQPSSSRAVNRPPSGDNNSDPDESKETSQEIGADSRICAVMTRPIPGYNNTFMLCSLSNNNNFTPLNNEALYLDNENHLVPVPLEALTETPQLPEGNPLSAVFLLDGEAIAQVVQGEQGENADGEEGQVEDGEAVEEGVVMPGGILGMMSPSNQLAEGHDDEEEEPEPSDGLVATDEAENPSPSEEIYQLQSNVLQLNVGGHQLEISTEVLMNIAEQQDDIIIEIDGGGQALLPAAEILQAAKNYLHERDLQLVNLEDLALHQCNHGAGSVPLIVPDLLSAALAGNSVGILHIETQSAAAGTGPVPTLATSGGAAGTGAEEDVIGFMAHTLPVSGSHLTPPITARTNETNALLDQTPIMSALEQPSTSASAALQLRAGSSSSSASPLSIDAIGGNLDDSLAVIGVTNGSGSGVPTSLELPITVTNPAIAPRCTTADMTKFVPFQ
ncbi:titin homolog [Drosophila navojoa]|uniref:titin homolog n=1 Tax=Drosophila navojoa TaxID=7232 RepID=UPI0011BFAD46|nr:titin homolog [Drosophila navojoa]